MSKETDSNKRIAKNAFLLYIRLLFSLVVTLYTSRVILETLGVEDFGIYNVVGGMVMMFNFLNAAMISSSQRFISYEQGTGDRNRQKIVYTTSVNIHALISIVVVILAETIGLYFLNNKMNISADRMIAANWVYQSAIITFVLNVLNVPQSASVIAHERMDFYAVVSILDTVLKLVIAISIAYFTIDKLIVYSILLITIALINITLYFIYTRIKFAECRYCYTLDKQLFKKMLSFAGWSFMGNFGITVKDYGVNIILNIFCGAAVNAARGIAYQVMGAVNGFVTSFQTAINPQIVKRYAKGNIESMVDLVEGGCKYSFFLLTVIVTPLIIRMPYVLELWLKNVPEYAIAFVSLALVMAVVNSMFNPLVTAVQATGNVKLFNIAVSLVMFCDLPISYIILSEGCTPYAVMFVAISTAIIGLFVRLIILSRYIKINALSFISRVFLKDFLLFGIIYFVPFLINPYISNSFIGLLIESIICVIWSSVVIYFIGFNDKEKSFVKAKVINKFEKNNII